MKYGVIKKEKVLWKSKTIILLSSKVPALRIPDNSSSEDSKDFRDVNAAIKICFEAFYNTNFPKYLYEMWKYVIMSDRSPGLCYSNNKVTSSHHQCVGQVPSVKQS